MEGGRGGRGGRGGKRGEERWGTKKNGHDDETRCWSGDENRQWCCGGVVVVFWGGPATSVKCRCRLEGHVICDPTSLSSPSREWEEETCYLLDSHHPWMGEGDLESRRD